MISMALVLSGGSLLQAAEPDEKAFGQISRPGSVDLAEATWLNDDDRIIDVTIEDESVAVVVTESVE